jgi:hypothetical protein
MNKLGDKLWICGCSFSAANQYHPGEHWSEILAKSLNMEMRTLARDSASNGLIMEQVDYVINEEKPSLVIFNSTLNPRLEFKGKSTSTEYVPKDGPFQFFYYDDISLPGFYGKPVSYMQNRKKFINTESRLISEAVGHTNRLELMKRISKINRLAPRYIDLYLNNLYDKSWEIKKQVLMFYGVLSRLEKKGIPYLFTPSPEMQDYNHYWFEYNSKKILTHRDLNVYNFWEDTPPDGIEGFAHLSKPSHKILADNIYKHIKDEKILGKQLL